MMYRLKDGVSIANLQMVMRPVLMVAGEIWAEQGKDYLLITSGCDGSHSVGSLHPYGLALDLELPTRPSIAVSELKRQLGRNYDVVLESDHVHIEYDP